MSEKVEQEKAKLKVLNSWSEVNLQTFINIGRIQGDDKLKDLRLQQRLRIVALLCEDFTFEDLCKLKNEHLGPILEATSFLDTMPPKREKKKPFLLDGKEFIFHPDYKNLTAGEMISIEQLIYDGQHQGINPTPGLLAILVRPTKVVPDGNGGMKTVISDFNADDFQERQEFLLQHLTADKFLHEINFFLKKGKDSAKDFKLSTANQKKKGSTKTAKK